MKQNGVEGNLLESLTNFLSERKQRVVLNGQHSKWANIEAGVPQRSILDPLPFLIYINDLPDDLISNFKLFANDTSFFSVINHKHLSANKLNEDLNRINNWAFQCKMNFNPYSRKLSFLANFKSQPIPR